MNFMRFKKAKCEVLHLARDNPQYQYRLGDKGIESSPAKKDLITESLRLEKTSKIIKSNHQSNTTMPAKPCPEVPRLHVF